MPGRSDGCRTRHDTPSPDGDADGDRLPVGMCVAEDLGDVDGDAVARAGDAFGDGDVVATWSFGGGRVTTTRTATTTSAATAAREPNTRRDECCREASLENVDAFIEGGAALRARHF